MHYHPNVSDSSEDNGSDFGPALRMLAESGSDWSEPVSFQDYLRSAFPQGDRKSKTADRISVQTLGDLDPALRRANVMVFHLGASIGARSRTTSFALVKCPRGVEEFFLIDEQIFPLESETFIPRASYQELYPFQLLGSIVEAGAVNLAIASGLLAEGLGLDEPSPRLAPATGASTYSFAVVPRSDIDVMWPHRAGQVETDAVIFARRSGRWTLFVLEAKHGRRASLSKAKLADAALAIGTKSVPKDVMIVPVYLRSWEEEGRLMFGVAECEMTDPRSERAPIADIRVRKARLFSMPFHFAKAPS